ncbi:MAG: aminoglycoside adenylyltransferase domain-containing protein [Anaerolineae bacterium]
MSQSPTPLPELNDVLAAMVAGQRAILGEQLVGVYLQGSFAAGGGDQSSDVDWVAAIREPLTEAQVGQLQALAARLFAMPITWAQHLEGSYITVEALRRLGDTPQQHWYLDNGSVTMERSDHDNTLVVRWTLHEHGIALYGPPIASLTDPVEPDALRAEVHAVFRDWGGAFLEDPSRVSSRWYQQFLVISYCRMLQTVQEGGIYSKPAGVAWGLAHLDPAWHDLIRRAWAERQEDIWAKVRQAPEVAEVQGTLAFVRYAIDLSDRLPSDDIDAEACLCR